MSRKSMTAGGDGTVPMSEAAKMLNEELNNKNLDLDNLSSDDEVSAHTISHHTIYESKIIS